MSLACALGLDTVADRLARGDRVERAMWVDVLAGADDLAAKRDERLAVLIANRTWGG